MALKRTLSSPFVPKERSGRMKMAGSAKKKKRAAGLEKSKTPVPKVIPVTLLSGFLGSGKTTLLQHILRSDHGLRIAVIVNDIGNVNVDANLIDKTHTLTRTQEKVVALQNGCICCTLRGDLLEELVRLSELQRFDYVIIESSGISEPEQVAETFDDRLAEQMRALGSQAADGGDATAGLDENMRRVLERVEKAGGLGKFARLDTTVTIIDCLTLFSDFDTAQVLSERRGDVDPEDERTVSELMVDQIEFADVIILNKTDRVDAETRERVRSLVRKLNHDAKVFETSYSRVPVKEIVDTGMFSLDRARLGSGWLQDLHEMSVRQINGKNTVTPKPETEEYNVRNFVYRRNKPFHPRRLHDLIHDKFIVQHEVDEVDEDEDEGSDEEEEENEDDNASNSQDQDQPDDRTSSTAPSTPPAPASKEKESEAPLPPPEETILQNKRSSPLFARLFRSKGEIFLATRPDHAGDWSQAGPVLTLRGSRHWFCTLPPEDYLTSNPEVDARIVFDIREGGKFGDRRQELVFIGEKLDIPKLTETLDTCLLTDGEWEAWKEVMWGCADKIADEETLGRLADMFEDGWPDWTSLEYSHEGHHHGLEEAS